MTTLPIGEQIEARIWFESTVSAAQRKLDNIVYTMKREATDVFAQKVQAKIDQIHSGEELSTTSVLSLSSYVKLLEDYENSGSFCILRELSDRLNASTAYVEETEVEQAS